MRPVSSSPVPRLLSRILLVLGVFTLPALLSAVLYHTRYLQLGRETVFWKWLLDFQLAWYIWAALTPVIFWLGRRFRIDTRAWLLPGLAHLLIGSLFAVIQIGLGVFISILVYQEPVTWEYYVGQVVPTLFGRFPAQLLVYALILGVFYAIDYQRQSRRRALQAARLEAELGRARLEALQQQLQPHFLFNTLNSISVLMQKGDTAAANQVLNHLSDLLREVLAKDNAQLVPLADELAFVRKYVAIEQVRYGERLRVEFNIAADALTTPVPNFIVQLLVENAIRHGVARKADAGRVTIAAAAAGNQLQISVSDDGDGIEAAAFKEGVGISNARRRLQYLYGDDHSFAIANQPSGGVIAQLTIPLTASTGDTV